jgi:membrane protease YdiL (CAAX protease family)
MTLLGKKEPPAWEWMLMAFQATVAAPLLEEILFRGILYPTVKRMVRPGLAVCLTAILFGAFHINLMAFISLTFLGVALTWLYEVTDNLLAPILAHSLFNLANFFQLVLDRPAM